MRLAGSFVRAVFIAAMACWALPVLAANQPPTISGYPASSIKVGSTYYFQPTAKDPENHALVFSITNKPAWASFNTATGLLSGKPATFGKWSSIIIKVSDGTTATSLPAFAITAWTAPTITGTPITSVSSGSTYSFTPKATDADGSALSFSITNKPSWATFDTLTGKLSGTPTAAGSTGNIIISVSDGKASAALAPFTLTVTASSSVTLSWTRPTTNVDSSTLTNLNTYKIYYGTSSAALTHSVAVPATASSYVVTGLARGTWYFAISSVNTVGTESAQSALLTKTL